MINTASPNVFLIVGQIRRYVFLIDLSDRESTELEHRPVLILNHIAANPMHLFHT